MFDEVFQVFCRILIDLQGMMRIRVAVRIETGLLAGTAAETAAIGSALYSDLIPQRIICQDILQYMHDSCVLYIVFQRRTLGSIGDIGRNDDTFLVMA